MIKVFLPSPQPDWLSCDLLVNIKFEDSSFARPTDHQYNEQCSWDKASYLNWLHTLAGPAICCSQKVLHAWKITYSFFLHIIVSKRNDSLWYVGGLYRLSNSANILWNPGFSTLYIGSISFTIQYVIELVSSIHFLAFSIIRLAANK